MKNNKRVLVVATSSKTRGGITAVINSYKNTKFWRDFNCVWIETHIDKSSILKIVFFVRSLTKFILLLPQTSLVHIHLSAPMSAIRKLPFLFIAKMFKIPIIVHFHAFSAASSIDKKHSKLYNIIFNTADTIIVLSKSWMSGLINDLGIDSKKIEVLYNPCPIINNVNNIIKTDTILYAGTLIGRKGYKDLINSFAIISKSYPTWKLVFAGNGEIEEGIKLSKKLNIENQVIFSGWVSGVDKQKLFNEAKLFCLPSYAEGFPMAILDAWAYGLPVITTPVGGIPDVAKDGINMLLFNPGDVDTLSKKLEIMISNYELRNKISDASLVFSLNEFSLNTIIKTLASIYKKHINCK
ncbi:MAG: glycosyltransferase family 1 protein [Sphingobacteriales bacterium]|nr:MAG: glycosyltransferase family 1 protein [Sphingobacteriales bacterium]TAF82304.1 MAG: glycosyltransferase family 1 protein [Sphingobacteriales bacterium]